MAYGVTTTGFNVKRFDDIKLEIETALRDAFGEIDTDADSVFGQIIGVFSRALAEIWEQSENVYNAMYPSSAEGLSLDNSASLVGIKRLAATPSTVMVLLEAVENTVVPLDTTVSQSLLTKQFKTLEEKQVTDANLHKVVIGIDSVVVGFEYSIDLNDGSISAYTAVGGDTAAIIAENLKNAINADVTINTLIVAQYTAGDDFLTILSLDLSSYEGIFSAWLSANLVFNEMWSPVACEAVDDGANPVPVGSIDTIITPVFGLNTVINLVEGTTGRELETDAELRIRRRNSLNIVASSTLSAILSHIIQDISAVSDAFIFENATDVVDAFGRPPHSFEVIVAALDTVEVNLEIARKIWERKPAGIATTGTKSVTIQDSNGDNQIVKFSYATPKYVHIKLEYDTTGADSSFLLNGEDLIKEAVMEVGDKFSFGADLLVQVFAAAGYAAGGVTSVVAKVAATANPGDIPSYQTTNLTINPSEYPTFDLTRITLVDVTP